ncbi:MAG TPA: flagellar basal-body MS-ring/collar protein FliF, partial [Anaerolineales bacterium]|nr:flagellar basal-body MS-ring/collar protein FliF [Anaerolineales bacterium]
MLIQLRDQSLKFWAAQGRTQRISLIALVVAAAAAIVAFMVWAATPQYVTAFSGLSEADAGAIVEQLQADGTTYQLGEDGQVLVPAAEVYEVRLRMATLGMPEDGAPGYELFSSNTLGMTDFLQRVNYQRAIEGELERTIKTLDPIKGVRVHLVQPERTLLAGDQQPTTASITVDLRPGQSLATGQVRAITHLVASAVEGLQPEHVVVVDATGTLLTADGATNGADASDISDARRYAEAQYASQVQGKVQQLLNQTLGPNKSVVQATVELDWTERQILDQAIDPETTSLRSQQVLTETYSGDGTVLGGIPGALTNLPPAAVTDTITDTTGALYQRYEITDNWEMSSTATTATIPAGQIARISLSVLVDSVTDTTQLETLRNAISAAAGISTTRGDTIAVETLPFDRTYFEAQTADLESAANMDLYLQIGVAVGGVLLLVGLLWYISRLMANVRLASAEAWAVMQPAQTALAAAAAASAVMP